MPYPSRPFTSSLMHTPWNWFAAGKAASESDGAAAGAPTLGTPPYISIEEELAGVACCGGSGGGGGGADGGGGGGDKSAVPFAAGDGRLCCCG